jgi:FkbH-like protein
MHIWEEHCTECAFPDCYKTCDLFEPRKDGNCRRFQDGVVPIEGLVSGGEPVTEITFKRWANMYAVGPAKLLRDKDARRLAGSTRFAAGVLRRVPDGGMKIKGLMGPFGRIARIFRRKLTDTMISASQYSTADAFVIAIYVPGDLVFDAALSIITDTTDSTGSYQKRLILNPGFHKIEIPIEEITRKTGNGLANFIALLPNTEGVSTNRIYLGYMGFVGFGAAAARNKIAPNKLPQIKPQSLKSIKIAVWDLDNTLWDGILVEDGVDNLVLKPGVADVIRALDKRGIVNSLASKNTAENAITALTRFGLTEYFVFPQINWGPKSQSLNQIIADFNVGSDTVAFIDDQPFERMEVANALPEVRTYDASDYQRILDFPEFNPEISSESASRRLHYINEGARRTQEMGYAKGDYDAFLRDCELQMQIHQGEGQDIDRIYELTQRTNQMNFSGTRYSREDIQNLLGNPSLDTFSLRCRDRFGDYGTVGFGLVARPKEPGEVPMVIDLAFSCRVQSKRAEHAFLAWLAENYELQEMKELRVRYVPSARNKAVAAVFGDMGFIEAAESTDERRVMSLPTSKARAAGYPWTITHIDFGSKTMKDAV